MQIRRAVSEDKPALIRLLIDFDNGSRKTLSERQLTFRKHKNLATFAEGTIDNYLSQPHHIVFVADDKGKLTGYIAGEIKEKPTRVYDREGYVDAWYVEEASQGKKIGKQLLDALVHEFEKADCTHIGLDTHLEDTKAISIYEHMGMTKRLVTFFKPLKDLT